MPPSFDTLTARLARLESDFDGDLEPRYPAPSLSVWLGDLDGSCWWSHRPDAPHYAASTMKLPLVIAAHRRVERGELDLDAPQQVRNEFASVLDGSPFEMDEDDDQDPATWAAVGGSRTLRELAEHAITHSGNLATNLLLDVVGLDEVAQVLRLAGCSPTTVVGRGIEDAVARESGVTNTVTAGDLGLLMAAVARQDPALGGPAVCGPVEQMLSRQQHRDQIPAGLPAGTPTASKSGWIPGVSHDVAIVRPAGEPPFVLAICTTVDLGEHEAAAFVASLAADVWAAGHEAGPTAGDDGGQPPADRGGEPPADRRGSTRATGGVSDDDD